MNNPKGLFFSICILATLLLSCKDNQSSTLVISQDITKEQLSNLVKEKPDLIFLDVRTPEEIAEGKINNALEIDYKSSTFDSEIDKLDKSKSYLIYCKSGGRSSKTLSLMKKKEFKECYNLVGGYTAYAKN